MNIRSISKAGRDLMISDPFYGFFLLNLNKHFSKDLPTAGVYRKGINLSLAVNPDFWEELPNNQRIGILKHELLHICFFHLDLVENYPNKKLFNIAADIEINQYINESDLPKGCLTLTTFPTIALEPKKGTHYYYKKLQDNLNLPKKGEGNSDGGSGDQDDSNDSSNNGDGKSNSNGNSSKYRDSKLDKMMQQGDFHESWKWYENLSSSEKRLIKKQVEHIMKETAKASKKSRGTLPAELKAKIDELFEIKEAVFNWKAYFRRVIGSSLEIYTRKTRRKNSKRFSGNPGLKIKKKQRILVGIDTSLSVNNSELLEFFSEIHHIYKAGVGITVIECDTKISDKYDYNGKFRGHVTGRGGTSFDPVIDYYNDHSDEYTTCVYFTDGEASAPKNKVKKPIIWIISSRGRVYDTLPGMVINIPSS